MAALLLVTTIAFEPTRLNDFVSYDDDLYVTGNGFVEAGITASSVYWAAVTVVSSNWHPVTLLSHLIDGQLFGLKPAGHHLMSLAFHLANTLLLFVLLRTLTGSIWRSALVAALFAVHPLRVEVVVWASQRKELLGLFFGLLAMLSYTRYIRAPTTRGYAWLLLLSGAAMLSKPMLVTLPALLMLLDYWPLESDSGEPRLTRGSFFSLIREKIAIFGFSFLVCLSTLTTQSSAMEFSESVPLELRSANAMVSYLRYIGVALWPVDLSILKPHPDLPGGTPWAAWQVIASALVLLAATIFALGRRSPRYLTMGWLWYLGTLVPVIGIVQVGGQALADRYTYLPMIGLVIALVFGSAAWLRSRLERSAASRVVLGVAIACLLALLITQTRTQVRVWRDSMALFQHALDTGARTPTTYYNLATTLANRGELDGAIPLYRSALAMLPPGQGANMRNNLGFALSRGSARPSPEAIELFEAAIAIHPQWHTPYFNLGSELHKQQRFDEAVPHYRKALRIKPDFPAAQQRLEAALSKHPLVLPPFEGI